MESKRLTLQKSIRHLGFGSKLRMPLVNAAIETMQMLLDGHPKAMKIRNDLPTDENIRIEFSSSESSAPISGTFDS